MISTFTCKQGPIRTHYIEIDGIRYLIQSFGSVKAGLGYGPSKCFTGYFVHLVPVDRKKVGATLRWDRWAKNIGHVEVDSNALKHFDPDPESRYEAIDMEKLLTELLAKFPDQAVPDPLLRDPHNQTT